MSGVTWLHLSDWHQKGADTNRDLQVKKLLDDIRQRRQRIASCLDRVDFVVFSGDVAFSGTAKEYEAAEECLLKPLREALGLSADRLFFVPGNHDLERNRIPVSLQDPLIDEQNADEWLREKLGIIRTPFTEYARFVERINPKQKSADYASSLSIDVEGKIITLLGLNSAWMCARNRTAAGEIDDKTHLVVGLSNRAGIEPVNRVLMGAT